VAVIALWSILTLTDLMIWIRLQSRSLIKMGGGDLLTNMNFRAGRTICHRAVDLVLTSNGDLAFTPDDDTRILQSFMLYLFTAKGERTDPTFGCALTTILHKKLTANTLNEAEKTVQEDLKRLFPDQGRILVRAKKVPSQNNNDVMIKILMAGKIYSIGINLDELLRSSTLALNLKHPLQEV
jgi:hypothetical protein